MTVLLTVDELRSADLDEVSRLVGDIQHVIQRDGRRFGFLVAGVLSLGYTVLSDRFR